MLKNLLRSAGAITVGQIVNIAGNLLLVPLFLTHWTNSVYGEWMALSALVAYLGTLDMGMNAAAGNSLVVAYARQDMARYRSLQASALLFYVAIAGSITVLAGMACLLLPLARWMGITETPPGTAALIVWTLAVRLMWQMPAAQIWGIYRTTGDLATTQWLWNLQFFGGLFATYCVLLLGGTPCEVALWGFAPLALVTFISWLMIRRRYPELLPNLFEANREDMAGLLRPSLYFGLITVAMALALNGPVTVVSRAAGGTAVALLVTTRTLATVMRQSQGVVTTAIWPHLTKLDAMGKSGALRMAHRLLVAISMVISVGFAAAIWVEGAEVIAMWTRGRIACDPFLLRLLLIGAVPQALWFASSTLLASTNKHQALAKAYLSSAIITIVVTAILVTKMGAAAAALGLLVGEGVACYHFVLKNGCLATGEPYATFARQTWCSLVAASILAGAAGLLAQGFTWGLAPVRWAETGAVTLSVSAVVVWFAFLDKHTKDFLVENFRSRMGMPRRCDERRKDRGSPGNMKLPEGSSVL